jgi:FG-GAP-like repeat/Bacterial Ig-like domain (group 3)/Divergent InlB B-repeat domain/FG-GAP repeat
MRLRKAVLWCFAFCVLAPQAANAQLGQGFCVKNLTTPTVFVPFNPYAVFEFQGVSSLVINTNGKITTYKPSSTVGLASVYQDGKYVGFISDASALSNFDQACINLPTFDDRPGPPLSGPEQRSVSPSQSPAAGQTNGEVVVDDFNGDGIPDSAVITPSGLTVTLLNADGTTLSTSSYPVPGIGPSVLSADFNGDGFMDLAATETDASGQGNVVVLLGKGDGTFGPATKFPTGSFAFYLATGDFNGDKHADLAVTNEPSAIGTAGNVAVLLGKGDGTFSPAVSYPVGEFPGTIVVADFNGDGKLDLMALDSQMGFGSYVNKVWALLGKGDGTFLPAVSTATGTGSGYLAFTDLNHDGDMDLVIADEFASAVAIMFGNGNGTFQPATEYVMAAQPVSIAVLPLGDGSTLLFTSDNLSSGRFNFFVTSDGTVGIPQIQNIGLGPTSIAAADLNGDHQPDLVITDAEAGNIYVELATGGGFFATPVKYSLGSQPGALALADLNGDGKIDVIAADATGLDVLLGKGDGTLGALKTFPAGGSLGSVTVADFNSDGKPDVAAANILQHPFGQDATSGVVSLFIGNGDGTFQNVRTISLAGGLLPLSTVTGDFNGDGKPDLIVAFSPTDYNQPGGLAVLLGKGDGTFQSPTNITLPGPIILQGVGSAASAALAVGDFNGDGKLDIVTAIHGAGSNQVAVLLGNGDGSFQTPILTSTSTGPPMIAVTDLNGDGKPDLVLADCCGLSEASFMFGNGDGTFKAEAQFPSGSNPRGIVAADFNGDGKPDLAVIGQVMSPQYGTLSVMLNPGSATNTTAATTTTASPVSAIFSPTAQSVTLNATVSSNSTPVAGGTVTFTVLGATDLANVTNGSASVTFSIPAGTAAGNYPIQAVYNPATGFATSTNTQQLSIAQATPVITWPTPASIVSGTPLSATQLDATANVPGAFTYTPPSTTVLPVGNNQTLSVLFTPTDATDYNTQTATASINVTAPSAPALTIAKSHSASFTAGGTGTYMITVANTVGAGPTSGAVTVTDNAPNGLTVTAMSGTGWSCPTLPTCMRSDTLQPGQSYLPIMVTVGVAANAPSSLTNMATVLGGGSASATAADPTSIGASAPGQFAFTWAANPAAGGSVTPASGSLFTAGTTITVSATPTACYLFSSYSGAIVGSTNPAMLLINAPQSVVANFALNAKTNVTPQITSQVSGFRYNRLTQNYSQGLTVTNNGAAVNGPVYVALDSLTAGATLVAALGATKCAAPTGSPYVLLSNIGIDAGQSLTLTLQFTSAAGPPFVFTPRYLAGTGLQ